MSNFRNFLGPDLNRNLDPTDSPAWVYKIVEAIVFIGFRAFGMYGLGLKWFRVQGVSRVKIWKAYVCSTNALCTVIQLHCLFSYTPYTALHSTMEAYIYICPDKRALSKPRKKGLGLRV